MQIGVYGSGYLGTIISACLADFGTPVICCHPDSSRMADMDSFARKAQVIFLAEDAPQHLSDLAIRIARSAPKPPIISLVTPVSVGSAAGVEKRLKEEKLKATIVSQP